MITEYCSHGDLLNFLRHKQETFLNFVMNMPEVPEETSDYKNVCEEKQFIRRYGSYWHAPSRWTLSNLYSTYTAAAW